MGFGGAEDARWPGGQEEKTPRLRFDPMAKKNEQKPKLGTALSTTTRSYPWMKISFA